MLRCLAISILMLPLWSWSTHGQGFWSEGDQGKVPVTPKSKITDHGFFSSSDPELLQFRSEYMRLQGATGGVIDSERSPANIMGSRPNSAHDAETADTTPAQGDLSPDLSASIPATPSDPELTSFRNFYATQMEGTTEAFGRSYWVGSYKTSPLLGGGTGFSGSDGSLWTTNPLLGGGFGVRSRGGYSFSTTPSLGGGSIWSGSNGSRWSSSPLLGGGSAFSSSSGRRWNSTPLLGGGTGYRSRGGGFITGTPLLGGGTRFQRR